MRQVLLDAWTTFAQCLEAMLVAELADNDSWRMLIDLTRSLDQDELADRFETAMRDEEDHLRDVRAWIRTATLGRAGTKSAAKGAARATKSGNGRRRVEASR